MGVIDRCKVLGETPGEDGGKGAGDASEDVGSC